jgi:hypothetical protein
MPRYTKRKTQPRTEQDIQKHHNDEAMDCINKIYTHLGNVHCELRNLLMLQSYGKLETLSAGDVHRLFIWLEASEDAYFVIRNSIFNKDIE